jgi:hypothetical protein
MQFDSYVKGPQKVINLENRLYPFGT